MAIKHLSDNDCIKDLRSSRDKLPYWFSGRASEMFNHNDYLLREAAISAVGRCRVRKYIPQLIKALNERADNDYALQVASIRALGDINDLAFITNFMDALLNGELLNVRRMARKQLDELLFNHDLRGRNGFGPGHHEILNDPNHTDPAGSNAIHAKQIDEQIRLTDLTAPVLYGLPVFCKYSNGQRPILERAVSELLPSTAKEEKVAETLLAWISCGMVYPTKKSKENFSNWWNIAKSGISFLPEWEEEVILEGATGSCDMLSRSLIALCRTRQIPGRLVIWYHVCGTRQHVMAELFINDRWLLYDPLLGIYWDSSAYEIWRKPKKMAGKRKVVRAGASRRQKLLDLYSLPEMFNQAGIVPVDRMGADI